MDGAYDEIITENPFYTVFKKEYNNLFQHCISQSWVLCVPRIGSLNTRIFTVEDVCAHILVPNVELPRTHYSTLTEKQVTVMNKVITIEATKSLPLQSHILFEETFYTEDHLKYKVWCIETPLEPSINKGDIISIDQLISINDCIYFLWTQAAGRHILDQIDQHVQNFLKKNKKFPLAIASLRDLIGELYTKCLQTALQNRRIREKSNYSKETLENMKLAVECYMQNMLYSTIFSPICTCAAYEDSHLNKKIRNLSDIQLRDLDVKKELYSAIPKAKQILSKINTFTTVLEKLMCIKKTLNAIKKTDIAHGTTSLLTTDDMLPVFVFLIIKSGSPNWYSQLIYMKEFSFSGITRGCGDEGAFLITTLEAVIEHIQSGAITGLPNPEAYYYDSELTEDKVKSFQNRKNSLTESVSTSDVSIGDETLEYVFDLIKSSHKEQVCTILERNQKHLSKIQQHSNGDITLDLTLLDDDDDDNDVFIYKDMCHPLCNCKKCNRKIFHNLLKTSPTIMSRDSHGLTPLHIACIYGKSSIVDSLLEMGAAVNVTDLNECTPLHYAASRGHQNSLLLLMHAGSGINDGNIDKNTPLHLSVNNGHLNCVKAIIYFAEHSRKTININCINQNRNTPLHLASKWGYEGIAKILIENGAEPSLQNQYGKNAFDYAHNLRILQVLKSCTPNLYEYIHISDTDIKSLNLRSTNKESQVQNESENLNVSITIDNLKKIDRVIKAISYGDVKLACFYMNIDYNSSAASNINTEGSCHPLCACQQCKRKGSCTTDFDVNFSDSRGQTALHCAAQYGFHELCNILIFNKANINCVNKKGETPLHLAALNNQTAVLKVLLDRGTNVNTMDLTGNTALHSASQMGNIGATKIIIRYNPNVSLLNTSQKTALDIAKENVFLTIIDLIERYDCI